MAIYCGIEDNVLSPEFNVDNGLHLSLSKTDEML
jgi:hypothetical protein